MKSKRTTKSETWGPDLQDRIVDEIDGATLSLALAHRTPIESIHDCRRRVKRARAGLRLLRSAETKKFKREDRVLADAARSLGPIRDGHVTYLRRPAELLPPPYSPKVARIVSHSMVALTGSAARISRWQSATIDKDQLESEIDQSYRTSWRSWQQASASLDDNELHQCRKSVKQLAYQIEILQDLEFLSDAVSERVEVLGHFGEQLGNHHDLSFAGPIDAYERRSLERDLTDLGRRAFALTPKKHRSYLRESRN